MRKIKGTIVIAMLICASFVSVCLARTPRSKGKLKHPTAFELLDKYAETQDKLHRSFIIKSQVSSVHSGVVWGGTWRADKQKTYSSIELRFDGDRICHRYYKWGHRDLQNKSIPKHNASYFSTLWDGRTHFSCQIHPAKGNPIGHLRICGKFSRERNQQVISFEYCGHELLGFFTGEYERVDSVLRKAIELSVKDRLEQLGGSDCYLIEALTKHARYKLWIDPQHGYNIAKAIVHWSEDAPPYGKEHWRTKNTLNSLENVRFKEIDDLWVPVEADIVLNKTLHNGEWTKQSWHHKLIEITLNPDHDALGSFVPDDIKNGAVVHLLRLDGGLEPKEEKHTWQDGQVVDEKGRVIMDCRPKKASGSAESKPKSAVRKRPSAWELLRKYAEQQAKVTVPRSKERIIHFPKDCSLGKLKIQTGIPASPYDLDNSAWGNDWEYIGQAMGDVAVPADKRVQLLVNRADSRDFSALRKLGPNDLYMLIIDYSVGPAIRPDETIMPHLSGLTGLKDLYLCMNNITPKGLQHIKGLKSLKKLVLSVECRFGDAALAELSELRSLEVLAFSGSTDSSLRHLTKLTSLRELRLDVSKIRGPGLVYLEKLPSLRYLILSGKNFGDDGLAYITNLKSLRRLKLWGAELKITDSGLAHLSKLTGLEELNFIWINRITDRGIMHLKPLRSLKKVDFQLSPITDKGLAHLTDLNSLESLEGVSLTDEGMAYLEQFGKLKCLNIRASRERPFTDNGLKHLAGLRYLEDLSISSKAITDAGLSHIARLNNLKKLHLDAVLITDEGLTKLTVLKSLDDLLLDTSKVTASGLAQLNALPNLTNLLVYSFAESESSLDISGMTKLQELDFAWNCPIRDKDLASMGELRQLRRLNINSSQTITDSGMAHLAGLTSLNWLTVYGDHDLTNDGLLYLSGMKRLGSLSLCGDFTDAGLRCLEGLTSINSLHITSKRRFSAVAIRRLRWKLPNLGIFQTQLQDSSSDRAKRRR